MKKLHAVPIALAEQEGFGLMTILPDQAVSNRTRCIVPFCRRTTRAECIAPNNEWICSTHWRMVPLRLKRMYSVAKRRASRYGGPNGDWFDRLKDRLWSRCKRAAIEAAAGIT